MEKGTILFHEEFRFTNGEFGEKLLIILNTPDPNVEPYLLCRVTSKENKKPKKFGCQEDISVFFLPANHDFFERDTWIQLYEVFPFDATTLLQDHFNRQLSVLGKLKDLTIRQLMNCIRKIKDISVIHKKMILKK
jgi:hypothetical protein